MRNIAILGSGIAGLSIGYWLKDLDDVSFKIIEKSSFYGGLARSFEWHGFDCDFATHRFYTTDDDVLSSMLSLVPMTRQIRRSKLYILDSWVNDPINPSELLKHISLKDKVQLLSDLLTQKRAIEHSENFKQFVVEKFGYYMYDIFFRPYTEKLFGLESEKISVEWAKNKVRLKNPFRGKKQSKKNSFSYFYYPVEGGYGVIADKLFQQVERHVAFNSEVTEIKRNGKDVVGIEYNHQGNSEFFPCDTVISTLPLSITSRFFGIDLPVLFRPVSSVYLWINKPSVMDYHWVYFIPDDISINRLVEFKNLNPLRAPSKTSVICAEVTQLSENVEQQVIKDLVKVGLISEKDILDSKLVQEGFGYPVYEIGIEEKVQKIKARIEDYQHVFLLGRSAEFIHREVDDIFGQAKVVAESINEQDIVIHEKVVKRMDHKSICVIVLTYNNYEDTVECLNSLQNLNDELHDILVVDNGSMDGSPQKLEEKFPDIDFLRLMKNVGVPAGFNHGIQHALKKGYEYVFILNNDTVVDPKIFEELLIVAENDPKCALVMPQILYYPPNDHEKSRKDIWSDGGYYRKFPPGIIHKDNRKNINSNEPRKVDYVPTCGLLIHRRAFTTVGLFDPGYFFFFEDWDYSERVRAANLNIWSVPSAKLWHKVSKSIRIDNELYWRTMGESTFRFFRRHYSFCSSIFQISYRIFRDILLSGNIKYWKSFLFGAVKGMKTNLNNYPDIANFMSNVDREHRENSSEV